jgi:RNA polymerase sigma-70 factor (ECF subfamily)
VNEEESAEELVQELFITLWQNRESLQIQTSIDQYLYASVRNRCFNVVKRRAFLRKTHENLLRDHSIEQDSLNEGINFKELESAVSSSINELPDRCRTIFHLSRNEGLSYKEIARKLEISEKTVENQISIALKKLRENLIEFFCFLLLVVFSGK